VFNGLPDPDRDRTDSRALVRAWAALLCAEGHRGDVDSTARELVTDDLQLAAELVIGSASDLVSQGRIPRAVYDDIVRRAIVRACTEIARLDLCEHAAALN
jgi:hypothetical protein